MINRFQRMLNPYAGFLGGGGGSSGGGGGGGGGGGVSDREFNNAIAQDNRNRAGISGGGNYYNNSGGGGQSAAQQQAAANAAAEAARQEQERRRQVEAARAAEAARQAEAAKQAEIARNKLEANTSFNATYDQMLNQIAGTKGYYTSDDIAYAQKQALESTDNSQYVTATTKGLFDAADKTYGADLYNDDWLDDTIDSYFKNVDDWSTEAEKNMPSVTTKKDDGFTWKGLFDSTKDALGFSDTETISITPVEFYDPKIDPDAAISSPAPSADVSVDSNGVTYVDAPFRQEGTLEEGGLGVSFGEQLDLSETSLDGLYKASQEITDRYGEGLRSEMEFTKDLLNAHVAAKESSIDFLSRDDRTIVINPETGRPQVGAGVNLSNIAATVVDYVANKVANYGLGYVAGTVVMAVTGIPTYALGAALTTEGVLNASNLAGNSLVDNKVSIDPDGKEWVQTTVAGNTSFTKLEDVVNNTATNIANANSAFESGEFNVADSLSSGIGLNNSSIEAAKANSNNSAPSKPNWYDSYDLDLSFEEAVAEVATGVGASAETVKAIEFTSKVANGEDFVEAAVGTYADKIVDILPEGYEQPTEAAIRIGLGEERVSVLGDVYGQDLGLDNPLGKASVESLNTYDQTGDTNKAIVDGFVTYIEEGGELPEFEVPEYISSNLDFDIPDVDFGGISFGDLPNFNILDGITSGLNVGSIDFSGVKVGELFNLPDMPNLPKVDLPDIPDLPDLGSLPQIAGNIDIGSLDWSGVDVTVPEVDLGFLKAEGVDVGSMDWSGTNIGKLGDIDIADLNLDFGELDSLAKGTTTIASVGASKDLLEGDSDLFGDAPEINRLSQKLLNAKLV